MLTRITSYNVCYTKLLRNGGTSGSGAQAADVNGSDAIGGFGGSGPFFGAFAYGDNTSLQVLAGSGGAGAGGGGGGYTVITSYSIHYTKLYETFSHT